MEKKFSSIILILFVIIIGLQLYLNFKVTDLRNDMGSSDQYLSDRLDKVLGEIYSIQSSIESN